MFKKIGAVILLVSDMDRSKDFYTRTLGMQLKHESADWIEFAKEGSTVVALHPIKKKKTKQDNHNAEVKRNISDILVGFNVSDLQSTCDELEKKNVKFYKEMSIEHFGKHAIIEDPDGHLISLAEIGAKDEYVQIPYYHGFAPI
ncbi:MAG TPA: VOC family protein [Nitrososphaeraceae archaeon]|nr:VOC family protein [Nitrososphaeraceae archaeon]